MAYSWDNRVKFIVRYMYDIDNNGFLDKNDFECLAVRNTVIETKGKWCENVFKKNQEIMANLWNEIADLADFNKVEFHNLSHQFKHHFAIPVVNAMWRVSLAETVSVVSGRRGFDRRV